MTFFGGVVWSAKVLVASVAVLGCVAFAVLVFLACFVGPKSSSWLGGD